jgi:hypothetical protein
MLNLLVEVGASILGKIRAALGPIPGVSLERTREIRPQVLRPVSAGDRRSASASDAKRGDPRRATSEPSDFE